MKSQAKNKKATKKTAAPAKAKKSTKKVAKKKKPAANPTGAKIADLLKNTLVSTPKEEPKTIRIETPKKPVMSTGMISAANYRPAQKTPVPIIKKSRFSAAGL